MENSYEEISLPASGALSINPQIESFLSETIKWGKFIAIMGFVGCGLLVLVGAALLFLPSADLTNKFTSGFGYIIGPMYIAMSLLYYFPSLYMYRFCKNARIAFDENDQNALTLSFESLKSNFKFWGIAILIMIVFYGLIFVFAIAGGILSTMI